MSELHDWQGAGLRASSGYEWFYFDAEHPQPGGGVVSISIMGPNPFDFRPFGRSSRGEPASCADCTRNGAAQRQNHYGVAVGGMLPQLGANPAFEIEGYFHLASPEREVKFTPSPWRLDFPGAIVQRSEGTSGLPTYQVQLDMEEPANALRLQGRLEFAATHREWKVPEGLLFQDVSDPTHEHRWAVHVPQARVSGELVLTVGGQSTTVPVAQWIGYHDHNWGTRPMAEGFGRWTWGRALLPDGHTVISAAIVPSPASGATAQRISHASVVLSPAGVVSEILARVEPVDAAPAGSTIEVPRTLEFGNASPDGGHRVRFNHQMVVGREMPNCYQRRLATVELLGPGGMQSGGLAVTETLVAASFP